MPRPQWAFDRRQCIATYAAPSVDCEQIWMDSVTDREPLRRKIQAMARALDEHRSPVTVDEVRAKAAVLEPDKPGGTATRTRLAVGLVAAVIVLGAIVAAAVLPSRGGDRPASTLSTAASSTSAPGMTTVAASTVPPSSVVGASLLIPPRAGAADDRTPILRLLDAPVDADERAEWAHDAVETAVEECMSRLGHAYLAVPFEEPVRSDPGQPNVGLSRESQTVLANECRPEASRRTSAIAPYESEYEELIMEAQASSEFATAQSAYVECLDGAGNDSASDELRISGCAATSGLNEQIAEADERAESALIRAHPEHFAHFIEQFPRP